jgi:hypothetical protein
MGVPGNGPSSYIDKRATRWALKGSIGAEGVVTDVLRGSATVSIEDVEGDDDRQMTR